MKKIFLIIMTGLFLTACSDSSNSTDDDTENPTGTDSVTDNTVDSNDGGTDVSNQDTDSTGIIDSEPEDSRIPVLIDADANNELDDQHAIAYLLLNGDTFKTDGMTVNATYNGGSVDAHYDEAQRVVDLCGATAQVPVYTGAHYDFEDTRDKVDQDSFDGDDGVNYIIAKAHEPSDKKLVLLPVGKLTNIALALKKDPSIADKVRIVWLGSNYPATGEYNQDNDEAALNYILDFDVPFEIAMVRYGANSGTDAVRVTRDEINSAMPGKGPTATAVEGRHGGEFTTFGDYSVDLFEHANLYGNPPSRALFDMAAVAIVKNPDWATPKEIPAPILENGSWVERPDNTRKIIIWEYFDSSAIISDFFATMDNYKVVY